MDPIGTSPHRKQELRSLSEQRRDYRDANGAKAMPNIPVAEIWRPVQQEVRGLLYLYLSDNGPDSIIDRHQIPSVNEVLRDGKTNRDRQRASPSSKS